MEYTIEGVPIVDLGPDRIAGRVVMQLNNFGEGKRYKLCHKHSITEIPADIPTYKTSYFLGLDKVKVSTQS